MTTRSSPDIRTGPVEKSKLKLTSGACVNDRPQNLQERHKDSGLQKNRLLRFGREFLLPKWRQIIWTLILTAGLAGVTGGYPLIIKHSFDAFDTVQSGNQDVIFYILIAVVSITALRSNLMYLQVVASNKIVWQVGTEMQKLVFARLMDADFARQTEVPPGDRVSRLTNDVMAVQGAVQATIGTAVRDVLTIIVLIGAMIHLDPIMSLIVLGVYPIAGWPIAAISKRLRDVAKLTQSELGDMTSLLSEKLSAARLIKTFRLENYAVSRLNASFEDIYSLRMKAVRARARLDPILEALGGLAVAGVIALAYWRISSGMASVGDFMGFVSALLLAAQPIRALGNLTARVNEGMAAADRLYELIDDQPCVIDRTGAKPLSISAGQITFDNVTFDYAGPGGDGEGQRPIAIRNFSLNVPGGATVALVGRSGAGKTTLVNLIPRLFDVTEGAILIDGQDIRDVTISSLRDAIAIVSQDVTLFDDTIAANIALGRPGASQDEIESAARAAAAHDFILEQSAGYNTQIGTTGQRLSGGQRQRLTLARAILKDAPILLLDEATSALDTHSEQIVQSTLTKFSQNKTMFIIAHRLSTVKNADLICVLADGRLIEMGNHKTLLARGGSYARLCQTQILAPEVDEAHG